MDSTPAAQPPLLLIRADADDRIGAGHVMRTLALAQAWQALGGRATYFSAAMFPTLVERLRESNLDVWHSTAPVGSSSDAERFVQLAKQHQAIAVVDGYQFDQSYLHQVAHLPTATLTIDDGARAGKYETDLVLDVGLEATSESYACRSTRTRLLLGPRYSLVRTEFIHHPRRQRERLGNVESILVSLGGADPTGSLPTIVRGLRRLKRSDLCIRVIAGFDAKARSSLRSIVEDDSRFQLFGYRDDMAEQYAWADLAICGGGGSNHEMAVFGTPRCLVVVADNQVANVREFERIGAAVNLGPATGLESERLASIVEQLLHDPEHIRAMATAAWRANDGLGAQRVVERLQEVNREKLAAPPVSGSDH